jgi:hypothetical protein
MPLEGNESENTPDTEQPSGQVQEPVETDGDELEPPVRDEKELARFHYEKRQAEKVKNKEEEPKDDISIEDERIIEKVIEKKFGTSFAELESQRQSQRVENELKDLIKSNPVLAKYENKIRTWANHPSRSHLKVESVAYEIAGKDLLKLGAQLADQANTEANATKPIGMTSKATPKPVSDMTPQEFEAYRDTILQG